MYADSVTNADIGICKGAITSRKTASNIWQFAGTLVLALALFAAPIHPARAAQDPTEFIDHLAQQAFATLRDDTISEFDRFDKFRTLLSTGVDLERVGRFVLGVYWRSADPAQRAEYNELFGDYIIASFAGRLKTYAHAEITIKGAITTANGQHMVTTLVSEPSATEPIRVDWRVRESDGRLQIIDIIIEGISLAISQRSEFASVIQGNAGDMSTLLARLRRVAEAPPQR